ncbi:MAG: preprotein translocase subunit SecG [Clostridia bacterium]|nr:preprotein translocase subunit SecG [Clostridia bacterium]MBR4443579.1 preprotein translocase subunit SecG [Clostridia bacterium]MCR4805183.1 preprotein translocase subunit SecG [Clostridia bacterium]
MAALLVIIQIFLIFSAIVLIVSVLMQQGNSAGLGEIGGGAETFLGKNKAKSYEGKLELATKVSAAVFVVLAILMTALQ